VQLAALQFPWFRCIINARLSDFFCCPLQGSVFTSSGKQLWLGQTQPHQSAMPNSNPPVHHTAWASAVKIQIPAQSETANPLLVPFVVLPLACGENLQLQ
jgi:hypothetical protein